MEMFFSQFHFLRPYALILIFFLIFIIYLFKKSSNMGSAWQKICAPELLAYLQQGEQQGRSSGLLWLLAVGGLLAILALAGPVWQKQPQAVYRDTSALVVALDLSRSMDAADVKPSRLVRAKQKLRDLLQLRKDGQTALLAFAGTAYVVTPLTDDIHTILSQLNGLSTDIMPQQGGNLDAAMQKAMALLQQASIQHGQLLFLTDSDDVSDAMVRQVVAAGHQLSIVSVGSQQGAPIPKLDGGFVSDAKGNIVIAKLHAQRLQQIASLGHGVYRELSLDNTDIAPVLARLKPSFMEQMRETASPASSTEYDVWREQGAWLLLLVIPLALLGFRRGVLVVVLCLSLQVKPVEANVWDDMWHTPNHQGEVLMQKKAYQKAAQHFDNPAWRMAAHYRSKDYQAALQDFMQIPEPSSDDWYNKGNALAHLGKLDAAISAYNMALEKKPTHMDAQANKALLEKLKKEQEKKENKNKSSKKQKKDPKNEKNNKKDQQSDHGKQGKQDDEKLGKDSQKQGKSKRQAQDQQPQSQQSKQQTQENPQRQPGSKQQDGKQVQAEKSAKHNAGKQQQSQVRKQEEKKKAQQHQRTEEEMKHLEAQQAFEQNLRRIPDDPGGLLRRKFLYQYQQQGGSSVQGGKAW